MKPEDDISAELLKALVHTVEYVGPKMLPAVEGWSWYDALVKFAPDDEEIRKLIELHRPKDNETLE